MFMAIRSYYDSYIALPAAEINFSIDRNSCRMDRASAAETVDSGSISG